MLDFQNLHGGSCTCSGYARPGEPIRFDSSRCPIHAPGATVTQVRTQVGWRCPVCECGNAPWMPYCSNCAQKASLDAAKEQGE